MYSENIKINNLHKYTFICSAAGSQDTFHIPLTKNKNFDIIQAFWHLELSRSL